MKRLIRKAGSDYTQARKYKQEDDVHWANVYNNMLGLSIKIQEELTNALENYDSDTANYVGEHPSTIVSNWLNNPSMAEDLSIDENQILRMIKPEIDAINWE